MNGTHATGIFGTPWFAGPSLSDAEPRTGPGVGARATSPTPRATAGRSHGRQECPSTSGGAPALRVERVSLPAIRTERLVLRRWLKRDRAPFAAMNADLEVTEYFPEPLSRERAMPSLTASRPASRSTASTLDAGGATQRCVHRVHRPQRAQLRGCVHPHRRGRLAPAAGGVGEGLCHRRGTGCARCRLRPDRTPRGGVLHQHGE